MKTDGASPLVQVALCSPPYRTLTYALPPWLPESAFAPGMRVIAPLGKGLRMGLVVGKALAEGNGTEEAGAYSVKPLLWPLNTTPLPAWYMEMALQLACRQAASPGRIFASLLPAGMRTTQVRIRFFGEGKPREIVVKALASLPENALRDLGTLWTQGLAEVGRSGLSPLDNELCVLLSDPPWPVRPVAKAQIALLEYLLEHGAVTRRKLQDALGKNAAPTLALLVARGMVALRPLEGETGTPPQTPLGALPPAPRQGGAPPAPRNPGKHCVAMFPGNGGQGDSVPLRESRGRSPLAGFGAVPPQYFTLTPHQNTVFAPLREAALSGTAQTRLLFGVTGSGKTAVYLELAREVLSLGRSVLLLAPEVALALKLRDDAEQALPGATRLLYHGYQTPAARESVFRNMQGNRAPVLVVGTRSALFLPVDNVGLIVLDEEHDSSFKQDEGFVYQAKELAWYRAGQEKALLLLGSATPDIKSYYAAARGAVSLHVLTERAGGGELPEIRLVKMLPGNAQAHLLAEESVTALRRVVTRGEQAVILLNRRGYAPQMYCLGCNATTKCPHCDIGLAYHKGRERLLCHYCGYSLPFPSPCAACGGMHFLPMGEGTERLEEHLAADLPPGAGVLRLDRDSTRRPGRMEEILHSFARKEAQVLVGTQMLSKGHHFPDVTLAVVADADLGLNLPDYRAAERTFQLLVQSAGRSGRGERAGCVIIQTRNPAHYCWEFVKNADYAGFFERELALRQRRKYPPFTRLALIRISHELTDARGPEAVTALGLCLREEGKRRALTVLGPAPAPLPLLKGRRRYHCLIKGQDWQEMRGLFSTVQAAAEKSGLRVRLDLDPVNML